MIPNQILEKLEKKKSFEVKFKDGEIIIEDYKGISKTTAEDVKSLIRGKRAKIDKKRMKIVEELISILVEKKIPFKFIFEQDPLIKFDLDRYIAISKDLIKIFGFQSEEDQPLNMVISVIKNQNYRFYRIAK